MPDAEFLEKYPLFRKCHLRLPPFLGEIHKPKITLPCESCKSDQTFLMRNEWSEGTAPNASSYQRVLVGRYNCIRCENYFVTFFLRASLPAEGWIQKVGQYPPIEEPIDRNVAKLLGPHLENYKKGLRCEAHGYGIGAYSYYRRIVESTIDTLLGMIPDLLDSAKQAEYSDILKRAVNAHNVTDKIELVKDRLPEQLSPSGKNPLGLLYGALSDGIHSRTDEECLEVAREIRTVLEFLIGELMRSKEARKEYVESLGRLLEKKSQKKS